MAAWRTQLLTGAHDRARHARHPGGAPPNAVAPVSLLSPPALPSDAGDWIPRSRKCTLSSFGLGGALLFALVTWLVLAFLFRAAPRTQEDSSLNGKTEFADAKVPRARS
jgi:hypothetical protein